MPAFISGVFWFLLSKHGKMQALSAFHFGGARPSLARPGRAAENTALNLNVPVCEVGSEPVILAVYQLLSSLPTSVLQLIPAAASAAG